MRDGGTIPRQPPDSDFVDFVIVKGHEALDDKQQSVHSVSYGVDAGSVKEEAAIRLASGGAKYSTIARPITEARTRLASPTSTQAVRASPTPSDSGAGTWDVTVSGTAVQQGVNADCDATTWTCPQNETNTIVAFQGEIGDWQQWPDSAQWNDFAGLDQWTNVELTEIPPQITGNPLTISEELGNSHELNGQAFEGFWYGVLRHALLVDMGINDPSTLTSAGISASVGTGTVTVTPGPTSTKIAITGITFSPRMVHIKRGSITPNAPTALSARRASATVANLTFHAARPRGSFVRSYQGRCVARHHPTRYGTGSRSPVKVTSLIRGVDYNCQVRAKASVGYGPWSTSTAARAASVASLTLSRSSVAYGHENAEKLTVKVTSPLGGTPAGTVTIKIKSTVLCAIRLANGTGSRTLSAKRLEPGTHSLTAFYGGSTSYIGTSASKTLKVTG